MRISILFSAFAVGVCKKNVLGMPPLGYHDQADQRSIAVESDGSLSVLGPHDDLNVDQQESRDGQMDELSSFLDLVRGENKDDMYRIGDDDGDDEQDAVVHGGESDSDTDTDTDDESLIDDKVSVQGKDAAEVANGGCDCLYCWNSKKPCNSGDGPRLCPGSWFKACFR